MFSFNCFASQIFLFYITQMIVVFLLEDAISISSVSHLPLDLLFTFSFAQNKKTLDRKENSNNVLTNFIFVFSVLITTKKKS
jgi:hypothetical protein